MSSDSIAKEASHSKRGFGRFESITAKPNIFQQTIGQEISEQSREANLTRRKCVRHLTTRLNANHILFKDLLQQIQLISK